MSHPLVALQNVPSTEHHPRVVPKEAIGQVANSPPCADIRLSRDSRIATPALTKSANCERKKKKKVHPTILYGASARDGKAHRKKDSYPARPCIERPPSLFNPPPTLHGTSTFRPPPTPRFTNPTTHFKLPPSHHAITHPRPTISALRIEPHHHPPLHLSRPTPLAPHPPQITYIHTYVPTASRAQCASSQPYPSWPS